MTICMANATSFLYLESIIAVVKVVTYRNINFSDLKILIHSEAVSERSDRARIKVNISKSMYTVNVDCPGGGGGGYVSLGPVIIRVNHFLKSTLNEDEVLGNFDTYTGKPFRHL